MIELKLRGPVIGLETTPEDSTYNGLAPAADGGVFATWGHTDFGRSDVDLVVARIGPDGGAVTDPWVYNLPFTFNEDKLVAPDLAALAGGGAIAVWQDIEPGAPQPGFGEPASRDIRGQVFGPDGAPLGDLLTIAEGSANQRGAQVAGLEGGGAVVLWEEVTVIGDTGFPETESDLFLRVLGEDGAPVSGVRAVNVFTEGRQTQADVAALPGGGFVAVWTSEGQIGEAEEFEVVARRFDAAGRPAGAEFVVNTVTLDSQTAPRVAALGDGGFAVSWVSDFDAPVRAAKFDAEGMRVGGEVFFSAGRFSRNDDPVIAALPGGGYAVAWESDANDSPGVDIRVAVQAVDAGGALSGPVVTLPEGALADQQEDGLEMTALADGRIMVSWRAPAETDYPFEEDLYAQILEAVLRGELIEGDDTGERLTGTPGADTILGNGGADVLIGAGGGDGMTGGPGADVFVFRPGEATVTVEDFDKRAGDRLALDDRFFGLGDGGIDPRPVSQAQARAALDAGKVIYDRDSGELWIDGDGAGRGAAPALVAVLEGGPGFTFEDVLLF